MTLYMIFNADGDAYVVEAHNTKEAVLGYVNYSISMRTHRAKAIMSQSTLEDCVAMANDLLYNDKISDIYSINERLFGIKGVEGKCVARYDDYKEYLQE